MRSAALLLGGVLSLLAGADFASAQENDNYRQYFKKPENTAEFWFALKFEMEVGKFDIAAEHLKGLLDGEPKDEDLMAIEAKEGMSAFLRLRTVPRWDENPRKNTQAKERVETLISRVTEALKKHLSDPKRLGKYATNLMATASERAFAINELRRSGAISIPYLISVLLNNLDDTEAYNAIVTALPHFNRDSVPPLLAALDVPNARVRENLVDALRHRPDFPRLSSSPETDPLPSLYYLAAAPESSPQLKQKSLQAIADLLGIKLDRVANARSELTRAAERYYYHKVKWPNPDTVTVWRWTDKGLTMQTVKASKAEEYYGLRYARQALEIDPRYEAAQIAFVSLATEKGIEGNLDKPLSAAAPKLKEMLSTINPDILVAALDRALADKRQATILGLVRALGDIGDQRAAKPRNQGQAVLVRALNFPDRRVQFAAADAVLRIGGNPPPQASGRVVEVLRRAIDMDATPKVLIADVNRERGEAVGNAAKAAGFEAIVVRTGRQVMHRLAEAADIDLILLDHQIFDPTLRDLLTQLRADVNVGLLPVVITIPPTANGQRPPDSVLRMGRLAAEFRHVWVMPATIDPDILKKDLPFYVAEALGQPLTEAERKDTTREAVLWLKRLAVGEVPGYNVKPAEDALLKAARSEELNGPAVEALGHVPTRNAQRELAHIVLDNSVRPEMRAAAALELSRNIQINGRGLLKTQIQGLEALFANAPDPKLKANVAVVLGSLRPDAARTGNRLKGYTPPAKEAAPAPEKEKKDEKKEKDEK